jgi:ankyrin repeat protein
MVRSNHTKHDSGACWGVAMKGMFGILGDTLDIFDRTLERIYASDPSSLAEVIHTYHRENDKQLSSFLDSVSLFHTPSEHKELFLPTHGFIDQRTSKSHLISLLMPIELEEKGGVVDLHSITGAGDKKQLQDYFNHFTQIVDSKKLTQPIVFVVGNSKHSITLGYLPTIKQWVLINANNLPSLRLDPNHIGSQFIEALMYSDTVAVFHWSAYVVNNSEALRYQQCLKEWESCEAWKAIHCPATQTCNRKNDASTSWLYLAILHEKINQIQALLEQGADTNVVGIKGRTPLMRAIFSGNADIVELLLEYGADPNHANPNLENFKGWTPLFLAVSRRHLDIVEFLLNAGANVNQQLEDGLTALFFAAQRGDLNIVKLLLKHGADINVLLTQSEAEYVSFATKNKKENEMVLFLFNEYLNSSIAKKCSQLSGFIKWSFFHNYGPSKLLGIENRYSMSPLQIAKMMGHKEVVACLESHVTCEVEAKRSHPA